MNSQASLMPAILRDINLRVALKRMADEAHRNDDGPLAAILEIAVRTVDQRIFEMENTLTLPSAESISTSQSCRNVRIGSRRTTIKLEESFWEALDAVATREQASVDEVCSRIAALCDGGNLTSAIRVFLLRDALLIREGNYRN